MGCEAIAHEADSGSRNNCFSKIMDIIHGKIQLVGQKYLDKTTLARKTRFGRHCAMLLQ